MYSLTFLCVAIALGQTYGSYVQNSVNCQGIACENVKTDIKVSCPNGQTFDGNVCVGSIGSDNSICPANTFWDGRRCYVPAQTQSVCRPGYRQRGQWCYPIQVQENCCNSCSTNCGAINPPPPFVPNPPPPFVPNPLPPLPPPPPTVPPIIHHTYECPSGFTLTDSECINIITVVHNCKDGFTIRDNSCYNTTEIVCPEDSELINDQCMKKSQREVICPSYFNWDGERCIQKMPPCQPGFVLNGDMCERTMQPTCASGQYYQDGHCYAEEILASKCQDGYTFNGRECFITESICPSGYNYEDNSCTLKTITRPIYVTVTQPAPQPTYPVNPVAPVQPVQPVQPDWGTIRPIQPINPEQPVLTPNPDWQQPIAPVVPYRPVCPNQGNRCPTYGSGYPVRPGYPIGGIQPTQPRKFCRPGFVMDNGVCIYQKVPTPPTTETFDTDDVEFRTKETGYTPVQSFGGVGPSITNTISNHNEINNATNIISTNTNNIQVHIGGKDGCGGYKVVVNNNETIHEADENCVQNETEVDEDTSSTDAKKCCEVVSPRQCVKKEEQWNCFYRVHRRCGSFCTTDKVYLAPRKHCYRNHHLMLPPRTFVGYRTRVQSHQSTSIDCSGCVSGGYNCSAECYDYGCDHCNYVDFQQFCQQYGGRGCAQEDTGCLS